MEVKYLAQNDVLPMAMPRDTRVTCDRRGPDLNYRCSSELCSVVTAVYRVEAKPPPEPTAVCPK